MSVSPPAQCRVYTPERLAIAMVEALDPGINDLWLDPCVGPGAFVRALRLCGVPRRRILAIDLDRTRGPEDGSACTIRGTDFFRWVRTAPQRFDKIVANPPYVPLRRLSKQLLRPLITRRHPHFRS